MMPNQTGPDRRILIRRTPGRRAPDLGSHDGWRPPGAGDAYKGPLLDALIALRAGDFSVRLPHDWTGIDGKIADTVNDIVTTHIMLAEAVERVSSAVGYEGKLGQRLYSTGPAVPGAGRSTRSIP